VAPVVKLGELMDYRGQVIELRNRIAQFRGPAAPAEAPEEEGDFGGATDVISILGESQLRVPSTLPNLLNSLTQTVAGDCERSVRLVTSGLEVVPASLAVRVRDICVQMIRNAIVHGIEHSEERMQGGKVPTATVTVAFEAEDPERYLLRIEDDGRGLNYEEILDRALRLGMVRPDQAMGMKPEAVFRLILEPGFTTAENVTVHAGRGVGLNMVSESLRECDGRLSIATKPGAYTRFVIRLPKQAAHESRPSVA
jgi:two-component system chemotaxis sensor kinase CheA